MAQHLHSRCPNRLRPNHIAGQHARISITVDSKGSVVRFTTGPGFCNVGEATCVATFASADWKIKTQDRRSAAEQHPGRLCAVLPTGGAVIAVSTGTTTPVPFAVAYLLVYPLPFPLMFTAHVRSRLHTNAVRRPMEATDPYQCFRVRPCAVQFQQRMQPEREDVGQSAARPTRRQRGTTD